MDHLCVSGAASCSLQYSVKCYPLTRLLLQTKTGPNSFSWWARLLFPGCLLNECRKCTVQAFGLDATLNSLWRPTLNRTSYSVSPVIKRGSTGLDFPRPILNIIFELKDIRSTHTLRRKCGTKVLAHGAEAGVPELPPTLDWLFSSHAEIGAECQPADYERPSRLRYSPLAQLSAQILCSSQNDSIN